VTPAWHFNKQHWNGVNLKGSLSDETIKKMIDHSYDLVKAPLPKKRK
ncbi:MAG: MmcQ/YjbR family DNA-binding protein, partial [Bacteroidales bacterium]